MLVQTTGLTTKPIYRPISIFGPLPWQIEPWRDKSPILLLTGSAGGGKSRLAAEKIHGFMKKYPRSTGLMLRKAREYAGKSIVPFMERTVIGDDPLVIKKKADTYFEYKNESMLYWGGMKNDEQREGLRSIGPDGSLDIVWIEEANAFTEEDFNELCARMRGIAAPWAQIVLSTNPDTPTHWINKRLILGNEASVYYSHAVDNFYLPPSYRDMLNRLTGVLKLRLVDGLWVQAEGAVYEEFDPDIHLVDPFEIPEDWRRFRSIDFGYTNPFVCQWWALDHDSRFYLYREVYMSQRLVEEHAAQIIRLSGKEKFEATISDHDAEDRATLHSRGISTIPANKTISTGIQAVIARLALANDGKPRIFIMRGALVEEDAKLGKLPKSTLEEFPGYVWPKSHDGRPVKEVPVKENDHGMDAMRYMIMHLDSGLPSAGDLVDFA